jgi:DNA-binding NtrC family response regulator
LVVAEESNTRATLCDWLRNEGYAVEAAADGLDALLQLTEFAPDILLADLEMPGMDGIVLMHEARERDRDVMVIVMTDQAGVERALGAMRQGAGDYLTTPVNHDELTLVLEREMERRRLRAEARRLRQLLAEQDREASAGASSPPGEPSTGPPPIPGAKLADLERHAILKTLEHTGGSTSRAAAILGISTRKIEYEVTTRPPPRIARGT